MGTLTLPYNDFITYFKDDFLFTKMLVFKFRFFLLNVLIWSICMVRIKIRTVLKLELNGLYQNVKNVDPRCLGSQENTKHKVQTVLMDTLYIHYMHILYESIYLVFFSDYKRFCFNKNTMEDECNCFHCRKVQPCSNVIMIQSKEEFNKIKRISKFV